MMQVDSLTGQISLSSMGRFLDLETIPRHLSIEVSVSDGKLSYASTVEVSLNDLNEQPLIKLMCTSNGVYNFCPHVDENTMTLKKTTTATPEGAFIVETMEQDVGKPECKWCEEKNLAKGCPEAKMCATEPPASSAGDDHAWEITGGNKGGTFSIARSGTNVACPQGRPHGLEGHRSA